MVSTAAAAAAVAAAILRRDTRARMYSNKSKHQISKKSKKMFCITKKKLVVFVDYY